MGSATGKLSSSSSSDKTPTGGGGWHGGRRRWWNRNWSSYNPYPYWPEPATTHIIQVPAPAAPAAPAGKVVTAEHKWGFLIALVALVALVFIASRRQ